MHLSATCGPHTKKTAIFGYLLPKRAGGTYKEAGMDVSRILIELRQECDPIEEAILSLERLAWGLGKRRGTSAVLDGGSEETPIWQKETH